MDAQTKAEQAISRHVRDAIEAAGCMPDGRSLEWHGADLESFAGAVLRALASGDSITDQWAAIREARDRHIIDPITDVAIDTDGADLAAEFDEADGETRVGRNYIAGTGYLKNAARVFPNMAACCGEIRAEFTDDDFRTLDAPEFMCAGACRVFELSSGSSFATQNTVIRGRS